MRKEPKFQFSFLERERAPQVKETKKVLHTYKNFFYILIKTLPRHMLNSSFERKQSPLWFNISNIARVDVHTMEASDVNDWIKTILAIPGAKIVTCNDTMGWLPEKCHCLCFETDHSNASGPLPLDPFSYDAYTSGQYFSSGITVPMSVPVSTLAPSPDLHKKLVSAGITYFLYQCEKIVSHQQRVYAESVVEVSANRRRKWKEQNLKIT